MNHRQVAVRLREQLEHFSGIFSPLFSKPRSRLITEMIYGIPASQDVKLSSIGRTLGEEISLKKTEERLSHHLADPELAQQIHEAIAVQAAPRVRRDTLIVIDPTDVRKWRSGCRIWRRCGMGVRGNWRLGTGRVWRWPASRRSVE